MYVCEYILYAVAGSATQLDTKQDGGPVPNRTLAFETNQIDRLAYKATEGNKKLRRTYVQFQSEKRVYCNISLAWWRHGQ